MGRWKIARGFETVVEGQLVQGHERCGRAKGGGEGTACIQASPVELEKLASVRRSEP